MIEDTRDARRAVSTTSSLSLQYMGSIYDDVRQWKREKDWDKLEYNATDCTVTARTWTGLIAEKEWAEPRTQKLYDIHKRLSQIAAEMHAHGVYVNVELREFMLWAIAQEIAEKTATFLKIVNLDGMRCNPNDLRSLIFKRHANQRISRYNLDDPLDPKLYTNDALTTCSVDESSLLSLITSGECSDELINIIDSYWICETAKKRRSFLKSEMVSHAIGRDGFLRPGWNSCGTDTMRFSCSEPNIMQIEQMLRAYMGPAPGWVMVHADKSQLELRVMATVADDGELQRRLDIGDVYGEDAKDWFGLPSTCNVKKAEPKKRQACKIIHLASQYAAGVATVHAQALREDRKMKFEGTRLLNKGFKKTYEATVAYWDAEFKNVLKTGYSEGRLLNGRRYYPRPPPITEVVNWPIQRTASEMMAQEMIELDTKLKKANLKARINIILHDAFDVHCPENEEAKVTEIMTEVMDREYTICGRKRRFPIEMKIARHRDGDTWASV